MKYSRKLIRDKNLIQLVPYIRTFKLRTFKDANVCSHVQSCKLVHVSGVHCHVRASFTNGCAFVYLTVQYCIDYSSTVSLFQAQDVRKQVYKSSSDVAGTATKHQLFFILLYFSWYCPIRLKTLSSFLCVFFMYYLCEKYYKPITVQYYIADCVGYLG